VPISSIDSTFTVLSAPMRVRISPRLAKRRAAASALSAATTIESVTRKALLISACPFCAAACRCRWRTRSNQEPFRRRGHNHACQRFAILCPRVRPNNGGLVAGSSQLVPSLVIVRRPFSLLQLHRRILPPHRRRSALEKVQVRRQSEASDQHRYRRAAPQATARPGGCCRHDARTPRHRPVLRWA
jgi:hypothetical protein